MDIPKIVFKDKGHEYIHRDQGRYDSVSSVIKSVQNEFDSDYWKVWKAWAKIYGDKRWPKMLFSSTGSAKPSIETMSDLFSSGVSIDQWLAAYNEVEVDWFMSSENGTAFHLDRELESYANGYIINSFMSNRKFDVDPAILEIRKGYDNCTLTDDLFDLPDGGIPEMLVFDEEWGICGQIDEGFIYEEDGFRYVSIGDFKTNAKKPKKTNYNQMLPPLSHISENKYNSYNLQTSLYMLMMERAGYKPGKLGIYHYTAYDPTTKNVMEMRYMREEALALAEHFVANRKKAA